MELDKDILVEGNKTYSKETCVFVPTAINVFFTKSVINKEGLPMGVRAVFSGAYIARCSYKGKTKYLGTYKSISEASEAYVNFKRCTALELANEWCGKVDERVIMKLNQYSENYQG